MISIENGFRPSLICCPKSRLSISCLRNASRRQLSPLLHEVMDSLNRVLQKRVTSMLACNSLHASTEGPSATIRQHYGRLSGIEWRITSIVANHLSSHPRKPCLKVTAGFSLGLCLTCLVLASAFPRRPSAPDACREFIWDQLPYELCDNAIRLPLQNSVADFWIQQADISPGMPGSICRAFTGLASAH